MMREDTIWRKIWRIIYPPIMYLLLDVIIVWLVQMLLVAWAPVAGGENSWLMRNAQTIATMVFLIISIPLLYRIFKNDFNPRSDYVIKKPWYMLLIFIMGVLASRGLSEAVSFLNLDGLLGTSYNELSKTIFSADAVLVTIQVVILAPLSEELLFRGIIYRRIEKYLGGYWIAALISAALFGVYHFNLTQGLFAFFIGMLSSAAYYQVRNLWASIAVHMGANAISVVLTYSGLEYSHVWMYVLEMLVTLAAAWAIYFFAIRPIVRQTTDYR